MKPSPFIDSCEPIDIYKLMEKRNMVYKSSQEVLKERAEQAKGVKQLKEKWKDVFSEPTIYRYTHEGCMFGSDY